MCNFSGSFVTHHDQKNWRLQQNSNSSVTISSVLPDGLPPSLMLTRRFRVLGPDIHPDSFM